MWITGSNYEHTQTTAAEREDALIDTRNVTLSKNDVKWKFSKIVIFKYPWKT